MARLARRVDKRVVTVVGGPGFGKTMLLVAAIDEPPGTAHRDVWLSCEPGDESAEHLVAGLAHALDLGPDSGLDAVLDAVWSRAPATVCFVLDDVHEVPDGSDGAAVLATLCTELSGNGHLVLASRDAIPIPLARLAAGDQLVRIQEDELLLDADELASFASSRSVDASLLGSTGGWPALAELTANAGADLVLDYLWQEVLSSIGAERTELLARFGTVGGGDDEIATALAGRPTTIDDVLASVPLTQRSVDGWAAVHPLWEPALRRVLDAEQADAARRDAAEVHRRRERFGPAVDLLVESEAWTEVLTVIREAALPTAASSIRVPPAEFGRWYRLLPEHTRDEPDALYAAGLELEARAPLDAGRLYQAAAVGYRERGDVDGELAVLSHEGILRWWVNDYGALFVIHQRLGELVEGGSDRAEVLRAVGFGAVAHLRGDSAAVLEQLDDAVQRADPWWVPMIRWLRSVAHRRNGDLTLAVHEVDRALDDAGGRPDAQLEIARQRANWLGGDIDEVLRVFGETSASYLRSGERFLARETGLELAAKQAFLGDVAAARATLDEATAVLTDVPNLLAMVLDVIARAAIAVADGDEHAAAALLRPVVIEGDGAVGRPEGWYWRDRAAIALTYLLVPESRPIWEVEPLGPAHQPGLALGIALNEVRGGDLAPVRQLEWPDSGVVRAHLPARLAVELAVAGMAAGNPPPEDLFAAIGAPVRVALRSLAGRAATGPTATVAKRLARDLPNAPPFRLRLSVLGPLEVSVDGEPVSHPDLRRQRVRELVGYLVAHRRARRAAVGEALWPDAGDPAHNLRVNLNYMQRVLQPDRADGERPYFVRTSSDWLELVDVPELEVDAWELERLLEEGEAADARGSVTDALTAYRRALPLWRDEPFADAPYADWATAPRARLQARFVDAAVRAGELSLAADATRDARDAAERALRADPACEPAYRLLIRLHLTQGDASGARAALERCRSALDELGVEPDRTTTELAATASP